MEREALKSLTLGTQVEYRPYGRRKWFPALFLKADNKGVTIKTPDGSEYEVYYRDVRVPQGKSPAPRTR